MEEPNFLRPTAALVEGQMINIVRHSNWLMTMYWRHVALQVVLFNCSEVDGSPRYRKLQCGPMLQANTEKAKGCIKRSNLAGQRLTVAAQYALQCVSIMSVAWC